MEKVVCTLRVKAACLCLCKLTSVLLTTTVSSTKHGVCQIDCGSRDGQIRRDSDDHTRTNLLYLQESSHSVLHFSQSTHLRTYKTGFNGRFNRRGHRGRDGLQSTPNPGFLGRNFSQLPTTGVLTGLSRFRNGPIIQTSSAPTQECRRCRRHNGHSLTAMQS